MESTFNIKDINELYIIISAQPNSYNINHVSDNAKFLLVYNGDKIKFDSVHQISELISAVNKTLDNNSDIQQVRDLVDFFKNISPNINEKIKDLKYYKQMSEEIGLRTIGFLPDLPVLELEKWNGDLPKSLRANVYPKISKNALDSVDSSYKQLNSRLLINTSTEFFGERDRYKALAGWGRSVAHDFHLAGDLQYVKLLDEVLPTIKSNLAKYFDKVERLINYIYVLNISETTGTNLSINNEGELTVINYKGDIVILPANKINNTPITPIVEI